MLGSTAQHHQHDTTLIGEWKLKPPQSYSTNCNVLKKCMKLVGRVTYMSD